MSTMLPAGVLSRLQSELGLVELAEVTADEIEANRRVVEARAPLGGRPQIAIWFVPLVDHVLKGGVRTIFAVAEQMSLRWGTLNYLVLDSFSGRDFDAKPLELELRKHFGHLKFTLIKHRRGVDDVAAIPASDVSFCTLWTTAYLLVKYNRTKRKYYFLQDYEPVFYPAGSVYGVIEATYRFGFSCIANTLGVAQRYRRYSSDVISFPPGIDQGVFFCDQDARPNSGRKRIVFYGRPANDRNAFALGLSVVRRIKSTLGDGVDIMSVGARWDPAQFGADGVLTNLGLLVDLREVANLYRSSHVGLVFMFSAHPSYQPLEYMACGCVPVTNWNENNEWILEHDRNCLFLNPVPQLMADEVVALLGSDDRLERLRTNGLETVRAFSWPRAYDLILEFIAG